MIRGLLSLYSWRYPQVLIYMLQSRQYHILPYLGWYWRTVDFSGIIRRRVLVETGTSKLLVRVLRIGMHLQVGVGLLLVVQGLRGDLSGGWQFGLALILAYPIVWAHVLAFVVEGWWLVHP
ncbi:MAG: hypothetical protein AAB834_03145, partial [Patescibacteria group bacterium]